jgi:hypothetical protein
MVYMVSTILLALFLLQIYSHQDFCNYKNRCGRKVTYSNAQCNTIFKQFLHVVSNMTADGYVVDWSDSVLLFVKANWTVPATQPPRLWSISVGLNDLEDACIVIETAQWIADNLSWRCALGENWQVISNIEEKLDASFPKPQTRETLFECD